MLNTIYHSPLFSGLEHFPFASFESLIMGHEHLRIELEAEQGKAIGRGEPLPDRGPRATHALCQIVPCLSLPPQIVECHAPPAMQVITHSSIPSALIIGTMHACCSGLSFWARFSSICADSCEAVSAQHSKDMGAHA